MEKKVKKPNHTVMSVSDTPGAKIITYDGGKAMTVGSSEKNQSLAGLKNVIKGSK